MNVTLVICAVVVTIAFVVLVVQAVLTLIQVRHTARAVELFALNANDKLTAMNSVVDAVKSVCLGISSGWFGLAQFIFNLFKRKKND